MKLLCLGTGAADWKLEKRTPEQKEWRYCCSTLVDGSLLIDPGPHIFHFAAEQHNEQLFDAVRDIIVTHSHGDHFSPATLLRLCEKNGCRVWGSFACMEKFRQKYPEKADLIDFHEICKFDRFKAGTYDIFTLPANHSTEFPTETPFHYIISDGEKKLFYGLDGAWLLREEWNAFRKTDVFDAMILDATMGDCPGDPRIFEHNTICMVEQMCETFRKLGIIRPESGKIYANHMALLLHTDHQALEKRLAPSDIIPCFDGMEIIV